MARFQHTVTLLPVPRRWFESFVVVIHELAESLDDDGQRLRLPDGRYLPGLRLVGGKHLKPGARYDLEDGNADETHGRATFTILAWDRHRRTSVDITVRGNDPAGSEPPLSCRLDLKTAERPQQVKLSVRLKAGAGAWSKYAEGHAELHLDLGRLWSSVTGTAPFKGPALSGTVKQTLVRARVTTITRSTHDRFWRVTVRARVKGRSIGRLLLPVVMTVAGRRARTSFVRALDDAARKWNGRIPELVRSDPSRLVDRVF